MSNPSSPSSRPPRERLALRKTAPKTTQEIVIDHEDVDDEDETVLASGSQGGTLTLLEEYSLRKRKPNRVVPVIMLACAVASLAFAYLSYKSL